MTAGGAVGQLTRLLALIPWLLSRPGVSIAETAREFGISESQLRADLGLAFFCGLPGHMPDDLIDVSLEDDRIVITNAETIARPLRLAPDEAVALLVGLRALADVPSPTGPDVLDRVIAKLERAAGDAADAHRHITVAIEGAGKSQDAVAQALREGRRLSLEYYVPARDEVTSRDVDPLRLLVVDGHSYLEAWCLLADDLRIFRLDRIQRADCPRHPGHSASGTSCASGHLRHRVSGVAGPAGAQPQRASGCSTRIRAQWWPPSPSWWSSSPSPTSAGPASCSSVSAVRSGPWHLLSWSTPYAGTPRQPSLPTGRPPSAGCPRLGRSGDSR